MSNLRLVSALGTASFVSLVLVACSVDSVVPDPVPAPAPSGSSTQGPTSPTDETDAAPAADAAAAVDAAPEASVDAGPPPTDVVGSAECTAWCAKKSTDCSRACSEQDCAIDRGQCAASTRAFLKCQAETGRWVCGADGFSIVSSCRRDTSLCR